MGGIDVMGVGVLGSRARGWDLHSNKHPMGLVVPADTDYLGILSFFLLVWPPRFQSLLIMGWCDSIPEHRI